MDLTVKKWISIPEEEYKQMVQDIKFLDALRAAGVDNWSGYDYALDILEEDE